MNMGKSEGQPAVRVLRNVLMQKVGHFPYPDTCRLGKGRLRKVPKKFCGNGPKLSLTDSQKMIAVTA